MKRLFYVFVYRAQMNFIHEDMRMYDSVVALADLACIGLFYTGGTDRMQFAEDICEIGWTE